MKGVCVFLFLLTVTTAGLSQPKYELRAAWIASVEHIDWPSEAAVGNVALQKKEFTDLLDLDQRLGLNAVVVQIRPTADAFYPNPVEPWSVWLTGKQGTPPEPYYDPLAFMIEETHKRGMEFHAWINPYRALYNSRRDVASPTHITRIHPEWFLVYDNTTLFNPGIPEVWDYVTNIVRYIVHNYKVDAIHFDDYFYPYRTKGEYFADDAAYARYNRGLDKETWRRSNVDSLIVRVTQAIKQENPYCKFGISPYGVWRNLSRDPEGSDTHSSQTNYDDLYANILLWLQKGWIDYVCPQLYWERSHRILPYDLLLDWWHAHTYGRQLFIGLGIYKAGTNPAWRNPRELPEQISLARLSSDGAIYFSNQNFIHNPLGWSDSLRYHFYKYPALVPPMRWIDSVPPPPPLVAEARTGDSVHIVLSGASAKPLRLFVIYRYLPGDTSTALDPEHIYKIIPAANQQAALAVPAEPGMRLSRGLGGGDALPGEGSSAAPGATGDDERIRWVATAVSITNLESRPAAL
ncbi:glycoside hydrolase family 10 protein [Dinghuibacter silviterrae]|uniref:Uncharacterized lipoprotein YddW (UPF0748 family) n=1 Tax=Dinghuibacter silviterrae TaxID=1539049 RepID=A0A4V3GLJ2_9BACT|nr:family 10 glycosylhydrolase [Dinghuibacter silviterrae]TDW99772.1 uncharacterized lipoprotein YddW (UPF0748 family) [Dinghuibacter silviterrae]